MSTNFFFRLLRLLLFPISLLYGLSVLIRNKLFDWGLKSSQEFDLPLISIGNITIGGTGKTPHVEYLISLLQSRLNVAVLSRGYARKTKGFVLADDTVTPKEIGDEPFQLKNKFQECTIAVCESRVKGIKQLNAKNSPDVILLDDAFQHRYVRPGLSILLIDFNRPVFKDFYLPTGNLREGFYSRNRADIVVVTKVPENIRNETLEKWKTKLRLNEKQALFFSSLAYGEVKPVFVNAKNTPLSLDTLTAKILLVTGIAEPKSLLTYLDNKGCCYTLLKYPDHHNFDQADTRKILNTLEELKDENAIILTTEKDAVRLMHLNSFPEHLKGRTYFIPISVKLLQNETNNFENYILRYVRKG